MLPLHPYFNGESKGQIVVENKIEISSYVLVALALVLTITLGLLPAFLAGFLVYRLVELGSIALERVGILPKIGRIVLLIIIVVLVVSGISFGGIGLVSGLTSGPESLSVLMRKIADVVDMARNRLPLDLQDYLPFNLEELRTLISDWLRAHANQLSIVGRDVGIFLTHIIVGMIIGGMAAIQSTTRRKLKPLTQVLYDRVIFLDRAFRRIVFSQIRISAFNTVLTTIFLVTVMPALGWPLPLTKTLIATTFVAGLLPIIGNLISNTAITLVAFSISPSAGAVALGFLVLIHKLEYFINARIVGGEIRARAWEILIAMLVMESAFGISGLVAAPIYYAYIKDELSARKLV